MRPVAILLVAAVLAAGEADPSVWLPEGAALTLRCPDLVRSQVRWEHTPYAQLAAKPWAAVTVGELRLRLERMAPGGSAALAALRSAALSLEPTADVDDPRVVAAVNGDPELGRVVLAGLVGLPGGLPPGDGGFPLGDGHLVIAGPAIAWSSAGAAPRAVAAGQPLDDGDVTVRIELPRWAATLGGATAVLPAQGVLTATVALDPAGLHEHLVLPGSPAGAAAWKAWADPEELAALPPTTLAAVTAAGAGLARALDPGTALADCEDALAGAGLPGWAETRAGLAGPCTAWIAEGVPFPSVTCALSLPEALARRWADGLGAKLNLAAAPDGTRAGYLGLLPLAVGWVADTAGGGGRLVLTSDPRGLDVWRTRTPGFADLAPVHASLAGAPPRCLALGAGRGGDSWAALAQLAVPVFAGMGNPHIVALPADIRALGGRGWFHAVLRPDGACELDSGGLLGGPACIGALASAAVPTVLWVQHELAREHHQPAPLPGPAPVEPRVF